VEMETERARGLELDERLGEPTATPTPSFDPVEAEMRRRAGIQTSPIPAEPTGPSGPALALKGLERVRTQFTAPIAATGLQIAESPIGSAIPGVTSLKELGRRVEDIGVPESISPLPRTRTFGEVGEFVNPFAAIAGDKEEQEKAQAVLEEAGLPRSLAAELILDPLNVLPGVGFTKIDDLARLVRLATRAKGAVKARALNALRNSDVIQQARRGIQEAGERGGVPLRGGELPGGSIAETSDEAITHISKGDPGPLPDQPPAGGGPPEGPRGPSPDDPEFDDILDAAIKGEKPDQALMRRHQGVIDARASQLAVEVTDNNKELVRISVGQNFRGSVVAKTEGSFDELNSLLHNPGAVA
ncbi:hypothetical protein LCGC14_3040200, partial [marine sediment metagenome]